MKLTRRTAVATVLVGSLMGVVVIAGNENRPPVVGGTAPTFTAKTMSGKDVSFPDGYKGKVVLLDFWATWCPPCRGEIPHLVATYEKHKGAHFEMLGVSHDKNRRIGKEVVEKFMTNNKMTWEQIYDDMTPIQSKFAVSGIPMPFLIDGDTGKVLAMGSELRGKKMDEIVSRHVAAKKAAAEKK